MASNDHKSLSDIWKLRSRGKSDSRRQKELVKKAIKEGKGGLVTQYDVISTDGNKKIKIPIRFLEQYRFKYGNSNKSSGAGQGVDTKPGQRFRINPDAKQKGSGSGQAGNNEEDLTYDVEASIDELVDMLLEDLNLPWLEEKQQTEFETENEELTSIEKKGIYSTLDKKRTLMNNIRRHAAKGEAKVGKFSNDDLRFKTWDPEVEYHSNAAIYLMMDRSGSMEDEKTQIAKTFFFWMVQFLKRKYKKIEIVFVAHDVKATIVEQESFFKLSSSGGTNCSSAYELALKNIQENHPPDLYNNYVFHFSDGDNYVEDNEKCIDAAHQLLPLVSLLGYGEIYAGRFSSWVAEDKLLSKMFSDSIRSKKFISLKFTEESNIFEKLKQFLSLGATEKSEK
jgi:sporulation protein YhbH